MSREYKPRRASQRWLAGAPEYVLDCFYDPKFADCYDVLFCGELLCKHEDSKPHSLANTSVAYLGMSPNPSHPGGVSMWGEFDAYECTNYRYARGKRRVTWASLPENIRKHVIARATSTN